MPRRLQRLLILLLVWARGGMTTRMTVKGYRRTPRSGRRLTCSWPRLILDASRVVEGVAMKSARLAQQVSLALVAINYEDPCLYSDLPSVRHGIKELAQLLARHECVKAGLEDLNSAASAH